MSTNLKIAPTIPSLLLPGIESEIAFRMDASRESFEAGDTDALMTRAESFREVATDMDALDLTAAERRQIRSILIAFGVYTEVQPGTECWVNGRRVKAHEFTLNGVGYAFDSWKPLEGATR